MTKNATKYLTIGVTIVAIVVIVLVISSAKKSKGGLKNGRSIIIGDSQTPYIDSQSKKAEKQEGLWKGGINLNWLLDKVKNYPVTKDVSNVVINIGTNGGFNANENISGLVKELKRVFPNARLLAVKGSWGWGGNKGISEQKVNKYYDIFKDNGVKILEPAIGSVSDPHGNLPIYKKIGESIDNAI